MVSEQSKIFLDISCELLRDGYPIRFRASGQSMKPTIKDGEIIIIEPVNAENINRGDIILCRMERGVIAHRVMAIEHEGSKQPRFILRGDSATSDDQAIAASDILGRVVGVERGGRAVNLSSVSAKKLAIIKTFLYKLQVRLAATLKPFFKA